MFLFFLSGVDDESALALLVALVLADHANHALAAHDLALLTDLLDARSDLHRITLRAFS
jgi:hypothetical protein